jgi:sterol carrier protein 2
MIAKQLIEGGVAVLIWFFLITRKNCALAVGFEKMERGSLGSKFQDRTNPMDKHMSTMAEVREIESSPFAPQMFGNAGREHMEKYGTTKEQVRPASDPPCEPSVRQDRVEKSQALV